MCGFRSIPVKSNQQGVLSVEAVAEIPIEITYHWLTTNLQVPSLTDEQPEIRTSDDEKILHQQFVRAVSSFEGIILSQIEMKNILAARLNHSIQAGLIILGLIAGGAAVAVSPDSQALLGASLVFVAVAGYLASRRIPRTPAADPGLSISWNAWAETWRIVRYARERRDVFLAILGISWFWFFGSAMTLQLPAYTLVIMNGNESITTALLVAFAVGVGLGALLCERMSGHRIELGLVPFGSIGLTLFAIDLYFAQPVPAATAVSSIGEFLARIEAGKSSPVRKISD